MNVTNYSLGANPPINEPVRGQDYSLRTGEPQGERELARVQTDQGPLEPALPGIPMRTTAVGWPQARLSNHQCPLMIRWG